MDLIGVADISLDKKYGRTLGNFMVDPFFIMAKENLISGRCSNI